MVLDSCSVAQTKKSMVYREVSHEKVGLLANCQIGCIKELSFVIVIWVYLELENLHLGIYQFQLGPPSECDWENHYWNYLCMPFRRSNLISRYILASLPYRQCSIHSLQYLSDPKEIIILKRSL